MFLCECKRKRKVRYHIGYHCQLVGLAKGSPSVEVIDTTSLNRSYERGYAQANADFPCAFRTTSREKLCHRFRLCVDKVVS